MPPLLFLAHRLPYPPNKGDKVRSYHFLKHLAQRYRVYLGTFIDDPADWQHVEKVNALCAEVYVEGIVPRRQRALSATGLFRGEPLTLSYFRSARLHRWVDEVVRRERIKTAFAFSSPMAQYVSDLRGVASIVDFVDLDSAKWSEYAHAKPWPFSAIYKRESSRLLVYEHAVAAHAEVVVFVTDEEASLYRRSAPSTARIATIRNGVDAEHFSPQHDFASPFANGEIPVVFTGAMDYWPNVDAVVWFARESLPALRQRHPALRFYIVGMNPSPAVQSLAGDAGVAVTGRVDDVRPYLRHARVVVAPLRVARGIQNKVLEAMAMGKATVVTPATAAGLGMTAAAELAVASTAEEFGLAVENLLDQQRATAMGECARERVRRDFSWGSSFEQLDSLLRTEPRPEHVDASELDLEAAVGHK
ncbi:MAG TPA: TIGR03087 family PEP-CTERM/XrtA system glycosyltransferase [Burkholderiales bacterium]|nr:TIGR03087 family PEP-CTERM/XrtA system glycosyltransferase [Burkholderiales bacterium]